MTTQTSNNARRFSPIFIATITPASVSTSTAKNGNKYAVMKGATIAREGQEAKVMTAMAFGKSHTEVDKLLRKGRAVDRAVRAEERRVGKERVSAGRSRWSPDHQQKK